MIEATLLDLLTDDAPASISAIGGRVHFGVLPKGTLYPALRVSQISITPPELRSDASRHPLKEERYQIDVSAKTYLESKNLATAIQAHLDCYQGAHDDETIELIELIDVRPGHDTGTDTHDTSIDITIKYRSNP